MSFLSGLQVFEFCTSKPFKCMTLLELNNRKFLSFGILVLCLWISVYMNLYEIMKQYLY